MIQLGKSGCQSDPVLFNSLVAADQLVHPCLRIGGGQVGVGDVVSAVVALAHVVHHVVAGIAACNLTVDDAGVAGLVA